jgi:hypothetical protein
LQLFDKLLEDEAVLDRGVQAWIACVLGVHGDLGIDKMDIRKLARAQQDVIYFFTWLDLKGFLLKYVKEMSVYAAAAGLSQSETNILGLTALIAKIRADSDLVGRELPRHWDDLLVPGLYLLGESRTHLRTLVRYHYDYGPAPSAERRARLCENILYTKRAMPNSSTYAQAQALIDHRKALGTERDRDASYPPGWETVQDDVKQCITAIVERVYGGHHFCPEEAFPSTSAAFSTMRQEGGALGEVMMVFDTLNRRSKPMVGEYETDFDRMVEVSPGVVREVRRSRRRTGQVNCLSSFITTRAVNRGGDTSYNLGELGEAEESLTHTVRPCSLASRTSARQTEGEVRIHAKPSVVCEPCKMRLVTLGEAPAYQRCIALQKFLHGTLKRHAVFQFIGHPISEEEFAARFPMHVRSTCSGGESGTTWGRPHVVLGDPSAYGAEIRRNLYQDDSDVVIVSGDYSAATDNLDPALSRFVWEEICRVVQVRGADGEWCPLAETEWALLGFDALVNHLLAYTYRDKRSVEVEHVEQKWGQLMGSPMSFPILNIVNAAVNAALVINSYWIDTGKDLSVWSALEGAHITTNGDDVILYLPRRHYNRWQRYVTSVGLSPSLGKNYTSGTVAIMNSEMRYAVRVAGPPQMTDVGELVYPSVWRYRSFFNSPLVLGMEAKGPDAGTYVADRMPPSLLGARARAVVRGIDVGSEVYFNRLRMFADCHEDLLKHIPAGVGWEVPESLGGLGIPQFRPDDVAFPKSVLSRAAYLACLDPITRLKSAMVPSPKPVLAWEKLLKSAMSGAEGETIERLDQRTLEDLRDTEMYAAMAGSRLRDGDDGAGVRRPKLAVLAAVLDKIDDIQYLDDDMREAAYESLWPGCLGGPRLGNCEIRAKKHNALRQCFTSWTNSLRKQMTHVAQVIDSSESGLRSMSVKTLREWSDHRTLITVDLRAGYDAAV